MNARLCIGMLLTYVPFLVAGCDQVKPLKMPTDTTKEGMGLFSGEKGYFDLTNICGTPADQQQKSCPKPDETKEE